MIAHFRLKLKLTTGLVFLSGLLLANASQNTPFAWSAYRKLSEETARTDRSSIQAELEILDIDKPTLPQRGRSWNFNPNRPDSWYSSEDGKQFGLILLSFQSPNGGWSKGIDFSNGPRVEGMSYGSEPTYISTIDNQATISQLRHFARAYRLTSDTTYKDAVQKTLQYICQSQYPSGGWPQIYPLAGGYHDHATFNDQATVNVLRVLLDITNTSEDFAWLSNEWKDKATQALENGVQFVINSQIQVNGQLQAWCQQHDPMTLAPRAARAYEMVSLSSSESSEILDLLIELDNPSPEILAAIEAAATWLEQVAITGYTYKRQPDRTLKITPSSSDQRIWARFYEIETNRPLFGDRDKSIHYNLEEISAERRRGYAWYRTSPESTLKRVQKWRDRQQAGALN